MNTENLGALQAELNLILEHLAVSEGIDRKFIQKEGQRVFEEIDILLLAAQNQLWGQRRLLWAA